MRISAISDVHVKTPQDEADKLLMKFLNHPLVQESEYVFLLGDIFDLMVGSHRQYLEEFEHIFSSMDVLVRKGVKVFFVEGNHDVHLEKLFRMKWPKGEIAPTQDPIVKTIDDKLYYFSHGDEHEVDNLSYHRYMNFIQSPPLRFVANYLMPYWILNFIGNRASKMSRKKGSRKFDAEKVRERFRSGVKQVTEGKYAFIIGGHSHVKDVYEINSQSKYVNNGYALISKSFITITDHKVAFEPLT